jgi:hypothetical protein
MAIYETPFAVLDWDKSLNAITLRWKAFAYGEAFQTAINKIVELLVEKNSSKFLNDTTHMRAVGSEDQVWVLENWVPRAKAAGLKWNAIVLPNSQFARNTVTEAVSRGENRAKGTPSFEIRYFETVEEAKEWLKSKE